MLCTPLVGQGVHTAASIYGLTIESSSIAARSVTMSKIDYVITALEEEGHYSVWYEGLKEPYLTVLKPKAHTCTCGDWIWRKRKPGLRCKHHDRVEQEGAWNE